VLRILFLGCSLLAEKKSPQRLPKSLLAEKKLLLAEEKSLLAEKKSLLAEKKSLLAEKKSPQQSE